MTENRAQPPTARMAAPSGHSVYSSRAPLLRRGRQPGRIRDSSAPLNSSVMKLDETARESARQGERIAGDDVLTIKEAAALLRVHPVTLRRKAVDWGVPHRRLGSEWRFSRKVLTAWLQEREAA